MRYFLGILFSFFFVFALFAALPEKSSVLEAENLKCVNQAWVTRAHFTGWYGGRPSAGYHLAGYNDVQGEAFGTMKSLQAGKHRLWIRYLDLLQSRGKSGFKVTLRQNGKMVGQKVFDKVSMRTTPEGKKHWNVGWAQFVWDSMEFDLLQSGDFDIKVEKLYPKKVTASGGRHLDVFIVTSDLNYVPRITDLYPCYVRIKMLPEQITPVAIHVFGRRSMEFPAWFTPHLNINRKGIFEGPDKGAGNMRTEHLRAGDVSPWIEISHYLSYNGSDQLTFYTLESYFKPRPTSAAFELQFSKAPSEDGIQAVFQRKGKGCGMLIEVNLANGMICSEEQESRKSLEYAQNTPEISGKVPLHFPFATGFGLNPQISDSRTVTKEIQALRLIGINTIAGMMEMGHEMRIPFYRGTNMYFHQMKNKCLQQPDLAKIESSMKNYAEKLKKNGLAACTYQLNMMDEPNIHMNHIEKCIFCQRHFSDYLKQENIVLSGEPTTNPADGARYYWSMRYRNHIMTEALRKGTLAAQKYMPQLPTTANFATDLVYSGNAVKDGCDWFEILNSGALTYGWGEDWANATRTYQVNGYYTDVLRAACRVRGVPFGMYNILERDPWEIQAKAFLLIGHGAKSIHFFNYGPSYSGSSDAQSHRSGIYGAIKGITVPSGAVEDILLKSKNARGDAAQLLSTTGDIWNLTKDNVFGKERIYLNLLLRHCNFRLDTLNEDALADELNHYTVLFVNDSHLKQSQVALLVQWIKDGGTLYLGAGALRFNENNNPLGLDQLLNLQRCEFILSQNPGRAQYEMPRLKKLGEYAGMPLSSGVQEPMYQIVKYGKGQIIIIGFFPGISYIGNAHPIKGMSYSILNFPQAHRFFIKSLPFPVRPRLTTDNYRVEANLLESPVADLIVLSNWTGKENTVKVTFGTEEKYKSISASGVRILKQTQNNGKLDLTVRTGPGGYIKCKK